MNISNRRLQAESEQKNIIIGLKQFGMAEYELQKYTSSLQSLVVSLTPIVNERYQINNRKYLLFTGVKYLQMIPFWRDCHFNWIEQDERTNALRKIGCMTNIKHPIRIVHAKSPANQ